jgi:hypothetical protein
MKTYDVMSKHVGPGGIKCPCCNPFKGAKKFGKPMMHRLTRRVAKFNIVKQVEE